VTLVRDVEVPVGAGVGRALQRRIGSCGQVGLASLGALDEGGRVGQTVGLVARGTLQQPAGGRPQYYGAPMCAPPPQLTGLGLG